MSPGWLLYNIWQIAQYFIISPLVIHLQVLWICVEVIDLTVGLYFTFYNSFDAINIERICLY